MPLLKDYITVRLYHTLGCTVIATAVLQSLREALPVHRIDVYSDNPDLIFGLAEVSNIFDLSKISLKSYDVDFKDYLEIRDPQNNRPFKHLFEHMIEIAEAALGLKLPRHFNPKIVLTRDEIVEAQITCAQLAGSCHLVWLQTKSCMPFKEWDDVCWDEVKETLSECIFVDLSLKQYNLRSAIALTKFCDAGITLDTFLLHGAEAVGATNVVALMITSHPEVVCYSGQTVISKADGSLTPATVADVVRKLLVKNPRSS